MEVALMVGRKLGTHEGQSLIRLTWAKDGKRTSLMQQSGFLSTEQHCFLVFLSLTKLQFGTKQKWNFFKTFLYIYSPWIMELSIWLLFGVYKLPPTWRWGKVSVFCCLLSSGARSYRRLVRSTSLQPVTLTVDALQKVWTDGCSKGKSKKANKQKQKRKTWRNSPWKPMVTSWKVREHVQKWKTSTFKGIKGANYRIFWEGTKTVRKRKRIEMYKNLTRESRVSTLIWVATSRSSLDRPPSSYFN